MKNIKKSFLFLILATAFNIKTKTENMPSLGLSNDFFIAWENNNINEKDMRALFGKSFGGWAIGKALFNYVRKILPEGSTILELGSGAGTAELAKFYTMFSIEHNSKWVGKYNSTYIYAPIVNRWYNVDVLKEKLPQHYELILVDGPPGNIGRMGFFTNLDLFNTDVPLIIDDVNRQAEFRLMVNVSKKLERPFTVFSSGNKKYGVIMPE